MYPKAFPDETMSQAPLAMPPLSLAPLIEGIAKQGYAVVPDFLANAGGVIASYVEWRQAKSGAITEMSETFEVIEDRLTIAYNDMLKRWASCPVMILP